MKKILALVLCGFLVACGGKSTEAGLSSVQASASKKNDTNSDKGTNVPSKPRSPSSFTLAVIPDTQKYSEKHPLIFESQTRWVADNYKKENIKFSFHVGDIVENPASDAEWLVATKAMSILDRNPETPYSILAGNHDIPALIASAYGTVTLPNHYDNKRNPEDERFTRFFSVQKQEQNFSTFKGADSTGLNSYHIFSDDDGQEYLVFALDWRASDDTIKWAKSVLQSHATLPTILTTHELMGDPRSTSESAPLSNNGKRLWDKLIKDNDQIFITFNGHWHGERAYKKKNAYGRDVWMILVDYQRGHRGGNGFLQLVEFDKSSNKLNFRSYSPYIQSLIDFSNKYPKYKLAKEDSKSTRWKFSIDMNFQERLNNFNQK